MVNNMENLKVLYMNHNGRGDSRMSQYVDYLISQGLDIKVVDSAEGVRGLSFDYVIVDEWVKEWDDEK